MFVIKVDVLWLWKVSLGKNSMYIAWRQTISWCNNSIKGHRVKFVKGWRCLAKFQLIVNWLFQQYRDMLLDQPEILNEFFSAFLSYLYLLSISFAVVFIYNTHNSLLQCFEFLYIWIDCVVYCFMCVCPTTKNSDLPQLPCQVKSLNYWKFWLHKPNGILILFSTYIHHN